MVINLDLLRAVGIALVTNSHLDLLYPDPRLGFGGALGNALFFALSGYGLAHSFHGRRLGFAEWYLRRIKRIYPSVWIVCVLTLTFWGSWSEQTLGSLAADFFWPTRHWFISAIMLFYIVFYALLASGKPSAFVKVAALLALPYVIGYFWFIDLGRWSIESGYFKWIFYGQVMLLGAAAANRESWLLSRSVRIETALFIVVLASYFCAKLVLSATGAWHYQIVLHILTLPLLLLAFRVCASYVVQRWVTSTTGGRVATFVSGVSLEIYLTQHLFHSHEWLRSLSFPLGLALAVLGIVTTSVFVSWLSNKARALSEQKVAQIAD